VSDAETIQQIADDALTVAEHLGFACPPLILSAAVAKVAVDIGFAIFLRLAAKSIVAQRAAQVAGVAAAESQAVTSAMARLRAPLPRICTPCAMALADHLAATGEAKP